MPHLTFWQTLQHSRTAASSQTLQLVHSDFQGSLAATAPKDSCPPTPARCRPASLHLCVEVNLIKPRLVELTGFEPVTPCLQSRCSPS